MARDRRGRGEKRAWAATLLPQRYRIWLEPPRSNLSP